MDVNFSYKYADLLIILIGLVFVLYFLAKRFTRERVIRFANFEVLEKIYHPGRFQAAFVPLIFRVLALVLIVLSISDVEVIEEGYVANTDFVLAIDTSSSMLTPDYEPHRLGLAKASALEWLSKLRDVRVGVVTFAGNSYTRIKPTDQLDEVSRVIERMGLDQPAGTAIGESLITASSLLRDSEKNKTIILITDGRNNVGVNMTEGLHALKTEKIRIIAIGIGSTGTGALSLPPELAGMNATAAESPDLDEETLKYLANETGGSYFHIRDADSFRRAFESGIEKSDVSKEVRTNMLIAACIILVIEWAFEITKYRALP